MSLSRLAGLQAWKRSGKAEASWVPSAALIGSAVFFAAFAVVGSPYAALAIWFARIAVLSAYFAALRGLIQRNFKDSPWRAALASVVGTVTQVGVIVGAGLMGFALSFVTASTMLAIGAGLTALSAILFLRQSSINK
jgi:predicted MFS family arabinose efflux permease